MKELVAILVVLLAVLVSIAKLLFTGFCLAIGFWAGHKLTTKADNWLDSQKLKSIEDKLLRESPQEYHRYKDETKQLPKLAGLCP